MQFAETTTDEMQIFMKENKKFSYDGIQDFLIVGRTFPSFASFSIS